MKIQTRILHHAIHDERITLLLEAIIDSATLGKETGPTHQKWQMLISINLTVSTKIISDTAKVSELKHTATEIGKT